MEDDGSFLSNSDTGGLYCVRGLVDTIVARVSISVLERWSMWSDWPRAGKIKSVSIYTLQRYAHCTSLPSMFGNAISKSDQGNSIFSAFIVKNHKFTIMSFHCHCVVNVTLGLYSYSHLSHLLL